jgi:hypothetical protein
VPTASAATAPSVTSRVVLRLFIIEPLESFDANVESDLDVSNITWVQICRQAQHIRRVAKTSLCLPPRVDA